MWREEANLALPLLRLLGSGIPRFSKNSFLLRGRARRVRRRITTRYLLFSLFYVFVRNAPEALAPRATNETRTTLVMDIWPAVPHLSQMRSWSRVPPSTPSAAFHARPALQHAVAEPGLREPWQLPDLVVVMGEGALPP